MPIIALLSGFIVSISTAVLVAASPAKYDALCAVSGAFDRCSVELGGNQILFVSIDGLHEMDFCATERVSYRSNPSSPYRKIAGSDSMLVEVVRQERGIDHDFLFKYFPEDAEGRIKRIVVRFKNHRVAIDFAKNVSQSIGSC